MTDKEKLIELYLQQLNDELKKGRILMYNIIGCAIQLLNNTQKPTNEIEDWVVSCEKFFRKF